jgi:hypothetical protein
MSYIGAQPTTAAFITDQFNGTGSQTAFTLSVAPANTNSILVAVSGVLQDPSTYSVSGTTLTFSAAPPAGTGNISVRFLGIPASGVVNTAYRTQTEFTATAGQTTFSVPSYTVGYIDVYRNGALLGSADFTATNGTTVVLAAGASAGDLVTTVSFYVSSVLNAIPAVANAVTTSYINDGAVTNSKITSMDGSKLTGTQVIPKATLPTGSVLQVVSQTFQGTQFVTTSNSMVATGFGTAITPTSSTSKILVSLSTSISYGGSGMGIAIYRGTTSVWNPSASDGSGFYGAIFNSHGIVSIEYLDSPATTSSTTYNLYAASRSSTSSTVNIDGTSTDGGTTITLMEIAA